MNQLTAQRREIGSLLTFDIETVPSQDPAFIESIYRDFNEQADREIEALAPPSKYKSPEAIEKWMTETLPLKINEIRVKAESEAREKHLKTSVNAAHGQIVSIAWKINDEPTKVLYGDTDFDLIWGFFSDVERLNRGSQRPQLLVGHNIINFDLRFLYQRAIINRIRPSLFLPWHARPWDSNLLFDTMVQWAGPQKTISMVDLANALGLEAKGAGMDGSQVYPAYLAGEIEKIAAYNIEDVEDTYRIYKRMTDLVDATEPEALEA